MGEKRLNKSGSGRKRILSRSRKTQKSSKRPIKIGSKREKAPSKKPSVFGKPMFSRDDLSLRKTRKEPFIGANYAAALIFLAFLLLLGGGVHVFALGFALFSTGVLLLRRPPIYGLGWSFDCGALLFVFGGLLTFFVNTGSLSIELANPAADAVTAEIRRHPWLGFEQFCITLACLAWFYMATNSHLNQEGRKRIYSLVALLALFLGVISVIGNFKNWDFPGSVEGIGFSLFAEEGQMSTLLLTAGLFSFCFGIESLGHRSSLHLIGILGGAFCFFALMVGEYVDELIFFYIGLALYYGIRLLNAEVLPKVKLIVGVSFAITLFAFLSNFIEIAKLAQETRVPVDTWGLFLSNPLLGIGLNNYNDWIPLFREFPISAYEKSTLPNDFLFLASGLGISGLFAIFLMLIGYLKELKLSQTIRVNTYRFIPLIAVLIYILFGFKGFPRHAIALVFLILFFLALALPVVGRKSNKIPKWLWSGAGIALIGIGSCWMLGALFFMPFHSSVYKAKQITLYETAKKKEDWDKALDKLTVISALEPFNWKWYQEKAKGALKLSDLKGAKMETERAFIVEPDFAEPAYNAGYNWLDFDLKEAEKMWLMALDKSGEGAAALYEQLLIEAAGNYQQLLVLERISKTDSNFGVLWLESLGMREFKLAISEYLDSSDALAQFNKEERTRILDCWVNFGDFEQTNLFLKKYSASVRAPWYFKSHVLKNEARFEEAAGILRSSLNTPALPEIRYTPTNVTILEREIVSGGTVPKKQLLLIGFCLVQKDYARGIKLLEEYVALPEAPIEMHFWQGEFNFLMGDFVNSWLGLDTYAREILNLKK